MRKEAFYTYLGANGSVETTIQLEGVPSVKRFRLMADEGKLLTNDDVHYTKMVKIPAAELDSWKEVDEGQK